MTNFDTFVKFLLGNYNIHRYLLCYKKVATVTLNLKYYQCRDIGVLLLRKYFLFKKDKTKPEPFAKKRINTK